ncbi:MAG: hypothetical protein KME45_03450 [Stenomitos rutilans HA7619-LM2]|jgi:hypothetical protein|nr:hypothetical protein [Stenomitos rutilans HA7619-LM2]MBW4469441.1 hypothetical protein [Stenomitos rutilans HA7619-LM2]
MIIPITAHTSPFTPALTSVSPEGLLTYLDARIGLTFEGLEVKNYGFTGKALDLNRLAAGHRITSRKSSGYAPRVETATIDVGRIFPCQPPQQGIADTTADDFYDLLKGAIVEWVNCKGGPFGIANQLDFEVNGVQGIGAVPNLAAGDMRSRWHIVMLTFELSLYAR